MNAKQILKKWNDLFRFPAAHRAEWQPEGWIIFTEDGKEHIGRHARAWFERERKIHARSIY